MDTINEAKEICPYSLSIIEGIPSIEKLQIRSPSLIILDDLYEACVQSAEISNIMTFSSRRLNISVILICQNIFLNGTYNLTIRRNMSYFLIFNSFDRSVLKTLSQQWFGKSNTLTDAMDQLAEFQDNPFLQYILIDVSHNSMLSHDLRIRTDLFNLEEPKFFCIKK